MNNTVIQGVVEPKAHSNASHEWLGYTMSMEKTWEEMTLEYKILTTRLVAERDMYLEYYEKGKETIAAYEKLATNAVSLLKAAYSENDELAAKLTIANGALEMARKSLAEKDEEVAMLRRDLARHGYGRDNW